nr:MULTISPECIES: hypothetical protein [unclassified Shinella]
MRPLEKQPETSNEIDEALSWHDGDARAAIATLLAECVYLRWQLELADRAMGAGFTRGCPPRVRRPSRCYSARRRRTVSRSASSLN